MTSRLLNPLSVPRSAPLSFKGLFAELGGGSFLTSWIDRFIKNTFYTSNTNIEKRSTSGKRISIALINKDSPLTNYILIQKDPFVNTLEKSIFYSAYLK